jgi:DNA-binding NtrC family response regulator/tetratricopeptide (TPR) repeat protein
MARANQIAPMHPTDRILGNCAAISALRAQIRRLAPFDRIGHPSVPTVLLYGETGTGKGLMARVIHDSGPRAQGPFLDVNCAAIPEALLEAELFGYEAGAFTDAKRTKPGLFEAASQGTLFLDEIDALPLPLQGKLLTAIDEKRVRHVGAVAAQAVDVKLIAATQAELSSHVAAGRFRADLHHRLAVIVLELPPLRERGDDMLVLAQQCLRQYAEGHGLVPKRLSRAAEAWLLDYSWPGNVRELSHLMERITLLISEIIIDPATLERLSLPQTSAPPKFPLTSADRALPDEASRIAQALGLTGGNVVRAARLLGMSRDAVRYRMRKYGIAFPFAQFSPLVAGEEPDGGNRHHPASTSTPVLPLQREPDAAGLLGSDPSTMARSAEPFGLTPRKPPPVVLSWERKPVAVLALELTWLAPAEDEDPRYEPWTAIERWEQAIVEKARGFDGVVLQCSPSLLLIAFGIPHTLEQLPQRAVQVALVLRQLVAAPPTGGFSPELRQAVHWGPLLVAVEAADSTGQVMALGDTLTRPVRLLGHTAPGEVIVSPEVAPLVGGWCELQACEGPFRAEPPDQIAAYIVVGLKPRRSLLEMDAQRRLSRFVGRERELATLGDLLVQAEEGRGQVIGMLGEPGIGKSRLCYEFTRAHVTHGWLRLEAGAASYDKSTPYLPVINLLKAYFQLEASDDVQTRHAKVTDKLLGLDTTLQPILPALLVLLEVPAEDPQWQALEPSQRRQRIMDAVKQLLLRESQVQPLCLVVENLHWVDGETQAFLDSLVESLPAARVLLLVSYRPDYHHGWTSKTYYTQLRLDPLPRESAQELAHSILGHDASVMSLRRRLIELTEGNPLFLEESIQALVQTQALTGERGAYRLAKAGQRMQIPATVHMVLAARIDRLPVEAKRLLQSAAVIGKDVPFSLLQALVERPAEALRQGLAHLQGAEFLYERSLFPELAYTFKHALTHEVAYESLQPEQRRTLHAQIIGAIETLYPEGLDEQVEQRAHHAFRAELWDKAVAYLRQAAGKASAHSAYREASAYLEQALAALRHLPENRDTLEQAIDLRFEFRRVLLPLGEFRRIHNLLRDAATLAEALNDQRRLGEVCRTICDSSWQMGDYGPALEFGQRALAISMALSDVRLQYDTNFKLAQIYYLLGEYGRAITYCKTAVSLEGMLPPQRVGPSGGTSVGVCTLLTLCLAELGAFAEGIIHGEEGLRRAEAADHPFPRTNSYSFIGYLYFRQGDLHKAIAMLERSMELCQVWQNQFSFPHIASPLGVAYALSGRVAEALPLLEQAVAQAASMGFMPFISRGLAALSEGYLLAGRIEDAIALAERALDLSREHKERGHEAWALRLLGEIHSHGDPPESDQAEASYRQALALAGELGMRPLAAHCHLGLCTLYAKIGQRELARASLSTAIELYHAMDMTFWLPQAEATLAQLGRG